MYLSGNAYSSYRYIIPFTKVYEVYNYLTTPDDSSSSYILLTGFTANTTSIKILFSYTSEF